MFLTKSGAMAAMRAAHMARTVIAKGPDADSRAEPVMRGRSAPLGFQGLSAQPSLTQTKSDTCQVPMVGGPVSSSFKGTN